MTQEDIRRQIDEIALRQAHLFFSENRHLDDDALDAGLFRAIRRVRESYENHPTMAEIANETVAAICAEVWRLRAEAKETDF
jgi:hypothetical protein